MLVRTEAAWWLGPMLVRGRPYPMVAERACAVREHVSCTHTAAVAKVVKARKRVVRQRRRWRNVINVVRHKVSHRA